VSVCLFVCLLVCLSVRISKNGTFQFHQIFSTSILLVAAARSSSDGNAIYHAYIGAETTSIFRRGRQVAAPEAKSGVSDCIWFLLSTNFLVQVDQSVACVVCRCIRKITFELSDILDVVIGHAGSF